MNLPELPSLLICLGVIISVFINDVSWALYIRRVGEGKALRAGFWASIIFLSGIMLTISALHNYWLILVAGVTTFVGTSLTVFLDKRKNKLL